MCLTKTSAALACGEPYSVIDIVISLFRARKPGHRNFIKPGERRCLFGGHTSAPSLNLGNSGTMQSEDSRDLPLRKTSLLASDSKPFSNATHCFLLKELGKRFTNFLDCKSAFTVS
jgi:hypothetical protein